MTSRYPPGLARFNAEQESAALAVLLEVCASRAWGNRLVARRPFATPDALLAAGDTATEGLSDEELAEAVAGHPPIGRPDQGDPASGREQRGMTGAPEAVKAEILELNLTYQRTFGHVFLICATGVTGEEMCAALKKRMANPPGRERQIVRAELGKINRIRLVRLMEEGEGGV